MMVVAIRVSTRVSRAWFLMFSTEMVLMFARREGLMFPSLYPAHPPSVASVKTAVTKSRKIRRGMGERIFIIRKKSRVRRPAGIRPTARGGKLLAALAVGRPPLERQRRRGAIGPLAPRGRSRGGIPRQCRV